MSQDQTNHQTNHLLRNAQAITLSGLRLIRDKRLILEIEKLEFAYGEVSTIIGPNGSGKTTLLMACAGLYSVIGTLDVEDKAIGEYSTVQLAKRIAFLPASTSLPFPLTVGALIDLAQPTLMARKQVIEEMELEPLEHIPVTKLSSGEARRAWIAMTLARQTRIILLDEPLSGLDPRYQVRLLDALSLRAKEGACIVFIAHDLPYAARADRVIALHKRIIRAGKPSEVLVPDILQRLYGVTVWRGVDETGAVFTFPKRSV